MLKLGFIGLGVMGQPMALNLRKAGHALSVYARNPAQSAPLLAAGAAVLATPTAVAQSSDVLFINVSDDAALEAVLFARGDTNSGAAAGLSAGAIVVDMGTTSPAFTRHLSERLAQQAVSLIDAPVSGGQAGAIAGTLSIMAGGPAAAFERVLPLFECEHPGDTRPRAAIEAARAWARGELRVGEARRAALAAHAAAREARSEPARAAARACGHAAATAHVATHAVAVLSYAANAAGHAAHDSEYQWQRTHLIGE